jgi:hypothetical protein
MKEKLPKGVRKTENAKPYHSTERRLRKVLTMIFGKKNVCVSVHPSWAVTEKGSLLEYDFSIPGELLFIEYNGIQHYQYPNFFHETRQDFLLQKRHDRTKKDLAKDHGWTLQVVRYDEEVTPENMRRILCR